MWRAYNMDDFGLDPESNTESLAQDVVPSLPMPPALPWLLPRLSVNTELQDVDRMVRIPPGFISC